MIIEIQLTTDHFMRGIRNQLRSRSFCYTKELHLNEATIGSILAMNGLLIAAIEMVLVYKLENRRPTVIYVTIGAFLMGFAFLLLKQKSRLLPRLN